MGIERQGHSATDRVRTELSFFQEIEHFARVARAIQNHSKKRGKSPANLFLVLRAQIIYYARASEN
jgi:hypothetical protein